MLKKEKELCNIWNALQRALIGNHQRAVNSKNKVEKKWERRGTDRRAKTQIISFINPCCCLHFYGGSLLKMRKCPPWPHIKEIATSLEAGGFYRHILQTSSPRSARICYYFSDAGSNVEVLGYITVPKQEPRSRLWYHLTLVASSNMWLSQRRRVEMLVVVVRAHKNGNMMEDVTCQSWTYSPWGRWGPWLSSSW